MTKPSGEGHLRRQLRVDRDTPEDPMLAIDHHLHVKGLALAGAHHINDPARAGPRDPVRKCTQRVRRGKDGPA